MQPSIETLQDPRQFEQIAALAHDDAMVAALNRFLRRWSPVSFGYLTANIAAAAVLAWSASRSATPFQDRLSSAGLGFAIAFIFVLPLHEAIHAVVYRLFGATNVQVRLQRRSFTAYCVADRFPLPAARFAIVCVMPFVAISAALLAFAAFDGSRSVLWSGALLLHTGGCSGDFALLNLLWTHRHRSGVHTWDDVKSSTTFFVAAR